MDTPACRATSFIVVNYLSIGHQFAGLWVPVLTSFGILRSLLLSFLTSLTGEWKRGRKFGNAPGGFRTGFAAAGLRIAQTDNADYEEVAHFARRSLAEEAGKEKGDPARAAAAILTALDAPQPPLHLFLGEDALHYAGD